MRGRGYRFFTVHSFTFRWSWTGHSSPLFFLMKKKGAAYGLLDGQIYPFSSCFFRNSFNAPCSGCVKEYTFLGMEFGALGFRSIAWSQERFLGNRCAFCSENTFWCHWYSSGSWFFSALRVSTFCIAVFRRFPYVIAFRRDTKVDLWASAVLITMGSWV